MGLRDILSRTIEYAKTPISDQAFLRHYNDALHDLAMLYDTAKTRRTQTIVCDDAAEFYELTNGCLKIERVLDGNNNYFKYFEVRGNKEIKFGTRGTYTIYELFNHDEVTSMDDDITIDTAYIKAIAEYIAAKATAETNPKRSEQLIANSAADAELANKNIKKVNNPNRRVYAPLFR